MKVLFIGNSQMKVYGLPRMSRELSESAPVDFPRIEPGEALAGGASLKSHWEKGEAPGSPRALIATGSWEYVVIQEHFNADRPLFETYATLFDDAIKAAGSKTLLFATASITRDSGLSFRYADLSKTLNDMQLEFGRRRNVPVAAAGYAWMKYLGPHPSEAQVLDLYHADRKHPGLKGTYIYACLLYAMMTGRNPAGLTHEVMDIQGGARLEKAEAARMQKAAWEQCLEARKQ